MGSAFSRKYNHHHQDHHNPNPTLPPPTPTPSASAGPPISTFPRPQLPPPPTSVPETFTVASSIPYSAPPQPQLPQQQRPYVPPYPPPLAPHSSVYSYATWQPNNYQYPSYRPYHVPQMNGWSSSNYRPPPALPAPVQPVPYVDHQSAKKVKNDVNVHKDTIRLQVDELNHDCHLVSFTFDALVDGSITILYFAKEGSNCTFTPIYPEMAPVRVPFQKGLGQKFFQQSGSGVDLGFFDTDDLSKPIPGEDAYPLVIVAESHAPPTSTDGALNDNPLDTSRHAQISQAVLEKKDGTDFQVKVVKQILWIDGMRYELREIFGIDSADEASSTNNESGKECIICLTEVKNTMVMPCRHMCMCSDCAKELRLQSNKCPVCRQPIDELVEIKVDDEGK